MSLDRVLLRAPGPDANASGLEPRVFTTILGAADAPEFHEAIHRLEHKHAIDAVRLSKADMSRRRLRTRSEHGSDIAIALPRDHRLYDGAVLHLDESSALVVRVETETWLRFAARDQASALALGYFCGNMHWRVRFEGDHILVAVDIEERFYHERLASMVDSGQVWLVSSPEGFADGT